MRHELDAYGGGLEDKPEIVALSQIDVLDEAELKKKATELKKACGQTRCFCSAITGRGMTTLAGTSGFIVAAQGNAPLRPNATRTGRTVTSRIIFGEEGEE